MLEAIVSIVEVLQGVFYQTHLTFSFFIQLLFSKLNLSPTPKIFIFSNIDFVISHPRKISEHKNSYIDKHTVMGPAKCFKRIVFKERDLVFIVMNRC